MGIDISYECAVGATSCYSANIKQADSVSGLTINLPKLDEINKLGIGTVLDPFTLTSAAVETGYITQAVLTDAQTIAAGSVTKIASLAMENLAVVHHILSFDYTRMSSATQFVAATGSLREFAPMTSIVGNEGDAKALSFVNATSFSSPSVEQAFVYRGQGYCAEESGEWGIYLGRSIQSTDPKFALDICLNLCEEYEWCLAAAADDSGYCEHYTDWNAFVIQGDNTISDKDMEDYSITVSGVRYNLGCEKTGSNACSAERVWGAGSVLDSGTSTWHCYSKWTMLEMMLDELPDDACAHCAKKVSISKNPQLSSVNFLTFESNQLTASNFSSFEMLDNNADLAINVPCSVNPFWSYLCSNCVQKPSTWQNFAEISMCPPSPPPSPPPARLCQRW